MFMPRIISLTHGRESGQPFDRDYRLFDTVYIHIRWDTPVSGFEAEDIILGNTFDPDVGFFRQGADGDTYFVF